MFWLLSQVDGSSGPGLGLGMMIFFTILALIILGTGIFVVGQQDMFIIQRFGKFQRVARAGLNFKIPIIDTVAGRQTLRIRELDIPGQFKTNDNVFVTMIIRVQYSVIEDRVADSFYKLSSPEQQITAFVLNVVRGEVAKMQLRDVFEHQDTIGSAINKDLSISMAEFGFQIRNALVNEVRPADEVVVAMNRVLASENDKIAARNQGEAHKVRLVLEAEAEAESKRLQGEGIAKQREAIVQGLSQSVEALKAAMPEADSNELMRLVLMNQYFDALRDISHGDKSKVIFVPSSPNAIQQLSDQFTQTFIASSEASTPVPTKPKAVTPPPMA
jgi:regulator of protease activity HflC (stomatin/prohibitin superfamily)